MTTGLIILNYNSSDDTINCIESIERVNTSPIKYIIVDNGSSNPYIVPKLNDYLKSKFASKHILLNENDKIPDILPYSTLLVSKNNTGYACGNKKGLKLAYHDKEIDTILIINNDVIFIDDFISPLRRWLWNDDKTMLVSPLILKRDGETIDPNCARRKKTYRYIIAWFIFIFSDIFGILRKMQKELFIINNNEIPSQNIKIEMPSGSCFMVKKKEFKQIDDFDPNTFLYYEEDILSAKISDYGKQCLLIPTYTCIHIGGSSTNKRSSNFIFRTSIESARYYAKKYLKVGFTKYIILYIITSLSLITHIFKNYFYKRIKN